MAWGLYFMLASIAFVCGSAIYWYYRKVHLKNIRLQEKIEKLRIEKESQNPKRLSRGKKDIKQKSKMKYIPENNYTSETGEYQVNDRSGNFQSPPYEGATSYVNDATSSGGLVYGYQTPQSNCINTDISSLSSQYSHKNPKNNYIMSHQDFQNGIGQTQIYSDAMMAPISEQYLQKNLTNPNIQYVENMATNSLHSQGTQSNTQYINDNLQLYQHDSQMMNNNSQPVLQPQLVPYQQCLSNQQYQLQLQYQQCRHPQQQTQQPQQQQQIQQQLQQQPLQQQQQQPLQQQISHHVHSSGVSQVTQRLPSKDSQKGLNPQQGMVQPSTSHDLSSQPAKGSQEQSLPQIHEQSSSRAGASAETQLSSHSGKRPSQSQDLEEQQQLIGGEVCHKNQSYSDGITAMCTSSCPQQQLHHQHTHQQPQLQPQKQQQQQQRTHQQPQQLKFHHQQTVQNNQQQQYHQQQFNHQEKQPQQRHVQQQKQLQQQPQIHQKQYQQIQQPQHQRQQQQPQKHQYQKR